jgi:four helix bundle protein
VRRKRVKYEEWEQTVPEAIRADLLWKMKAYRLSLLVADLGWHDATKLIGDRRTTALSNQLYRALGSVGANLAEGYSRGTGRDRARFYEYSLGSARESRDWYYKGRHILGGDVVTHRMQLLTEIVRLLLTMIPHQRGRVLREKEMSYQTESHEAELDAAILPELSELLQNVPVP